MNTWTHVNTRIEKGSQICLKIVLCVKSLDIWTHAHTRIEKGSETFLKILLYVKSLDVMQTQELKKNLKCF